MRSALSRLGLRIYLVALTPILAIIGVVAVLSTLRPTPTPPRFEIDHAHRAAEAVARVLDDPPALARALEDIHASATIFGADGVVIASNTEPPLPPVSGDDVKRLDTEPEVIGPGIPSLIAVRLPPPSAGYLQFRMTRPDFRPGSMRPGEPLLPGERRHGGPLEPVVWTVIIALLASAIAAVFVARNVTRPLRALSATANRFGEGDLSARAQLQRKDELGDLGRAFDRMAERISDLVRSQQELLANVSHELRTPLARIRVALDIAAEGDAESARESLSEITADLAELEQLVSEVLTSARLDLAQSRVSGFEVSGQEVSLAVIVDKAIERFQGRTPERALELVGDPLEGATLKGDPVLLRRAFDNLLDNARAYSEPTSMVTIDVKRGPTGTTIAIIDRGIGIVAEDLARLGTPFFRTDRSRSRRSGGLGLGLSLTRRIVEAHGGTLTIASVVGQGTTVTVALPARASG